jgi:hypothetical protein
MKRIHFYWLNTLNFLDNSRPISVPTFIDCKRQLFGCSWNVYGLILIESTRDLFGQSWHLYGPIHDTCYVLYLDAGTNIYGFIDEIIVRTTANRINNPLERFNRLIMSYNAHRWNAYSLWYTVGLLRRVYYGHIYIAHVIVPCNQLLNTA